jgi:hypothetical protein
VGKLGIQQQWTSFHGVKRWVEVFSAEKGLKIIVDMRRSVFLPVGACPPCDSGVEGKSSITASLASPPTSELLVYRWISLLVGL